MTTDVKDLVERLRVTWDVSEEAASALNTLASEIAELKDEARTFSGEAANNRLRAEAAERERDAFRAENERLQVVIKDLELACEQLAAGRSDRAYHTMIEDGQSNALLRLDVARAAARAALHPTQGVGDAD